MATSRERMSPPPLPAKLTNLGPALVVGTIGWAVAICALGVTYLLGYPVQLWLATAIVGLCLGGIALSMLAWQRRAVRRGSRWVSRAE